MKKYLLTMLAVLVGSNMWAQSFSTEDGDNTLVITTDGDMTAQTYADNVSDHMKKGNYGYSKVIVNGNGIISEAFLRAILYSAYAPNTSLVNLDLKGITLKGWKSSSFKASEDDNWQYGQLNISELDLPKAEDNKVPDEAFSMWGSTLKIVVIPEGTEEIGKSAFYGINSLSSVSFPSSLKKIDDLAFANLSNWKSVELNDGLEFIGNSAFLNTSAIVNKTLEIPASVKYIGPGAFCFRQYQEVYFLGKEAPLCPLGEVKGNNLKGLFGPFGTESLMGNGGFNSAAGELADDANQGVANRENYKNGAYFCIMHYPENLSDEQKAKYTDITKTYVTWEGNEYGQTTGFYYGATRKVGKESSTLSWNGFQTYSGIVNPGYKDTYLGDQYIWPSQTQWLRSYITASNGLCWDGVTAYKPTLTAEQIALLRKVGFSETEYNDEALAKIAHVGTRQFVLTADDATTTPEFPLPLKKGGRWWTLCVPFNMTKKMVDDAMGEGTQVCRFSSVKREMDMDGRGRGNGKRGHHITLQFRNDVYKHKYVRNDDGTYPDWDPTAAACSDDDIVIYAHEPYMVYPTKNSDDPKDFVVKEYEAVPGSPLPTVIQPVEIQYNNGMQNQSEHSVGDYRFIGNYINQTVNDKNVNVPVNSYFYGKATASDTESKFWFWPYDAALTWPSHKCTVQTTDASLGIQDAKDFFNFEAGLSASSKTQSSLFGEDVFDDNGTTSIDKVEIVAGEDSQEIYNISGQLVSTNGTFVGLPKGIYVKGGKKFVVK